MKIVEELLPGVFLIEPSSFVDDRGNFVKTYHLDTWNGLGLPFEMKEEFYSFSKKDVIRGMHFQVPPADHRKVVCCMSGAVFDVLVDIRQGPNFGATGSVELSVENRLILYIPSGIAHGFKSLRDDTLMLYKTDTVHNAAYDRGLHWDSVGIDWRVNKPIVSTRDSMHPKLAEFQTPFF